jgi:hypothetical protein
VRSVVIPAAMRLLDERSWYLPTALEWLLDVHIEGAPAAAIAAERPATERPMQVA